MAIPHYVYLLLKMPAEKGVLSLRGNVLIAYNYEKEVYATAKALELFIRMQQSIADAKKIPPADLEISSKEATRAAAKSKETMEVELLPGDKTKTARIEAAPRPQIGRHARQLPEGEHQCVCMEACRHARCTLGVDRALLGCFEDRQANQAKAMMVCMEQKGGN
jgi:hypothetical protein